jgi:hypothetical protein
LLLSHESNDRNKNSIRENKSAVLLHIVDNKKYDINFPLIVQAPEFPNCKLFSLLVTGGLEDDKLRLKQFKSSQRISSKVEFGRKLRFLGQRENYVNVSGVTAAKVITQDV